MINDENKKAMDSKLKLLDERERDINRVKKILEEKDQENMHLTT